MGWSDVSPSDLATIQECVGYMASTAQEYGRQYGTTPGQQAITSQRLSAKMSAGFEEMKYLDSYQGLGSVVLIFQKMKWMSLYANPSLGEVWSMSVGFEDSVLPQGGPDQAYADFLDALNAQGGPFDRFLTKHNVSSLFGVGPVGGAAPTRSRQIGQLQIVATTIWKPKRGNWSIRPQITVNSAYIGSNGQPPPGGVLQHWGTYTGFVFSLTQAVFTP